MENRSERAVARFMEGYSCAQAVSSVFAEEVGMPEEVLIRAATGFGGGMGHTGGACGVVSAAALILGLKFGNTRPDDRQAKEDTYALVREFVIRFTVRNGSVSCTDLLGCNLSTEEGRQRAREENLTRTVCPQYIRDAVEILEAILGPGPVIP
jgi:C_GCAxxG_C_C family probable redox protein